MADGAKPVTGSVTEKIPGNNGSRIAFWLIPAEDDYNHLQQIIDTYAERLDTPTFEPHLTLLARPAKEKDDPAAELKELATVAQPFSLSGPGRPYWGPVYNQAFVLPFNLSTQLQHLVKTLHPLQIVPEDYFPHISLIYANLERDVGMRLQKEYQSFGRSILFDRCAAISIGPHCLCDADVRRWETIAMVEL